MGWGGGCGKGRRCTPAARVAKKLFTVTFCIFRILYYMKIITYSKIKIIKDSVEQKLKKKKLPIDASLLQKFPNLEKQGVIFLRNTHLA